MITWTSFENVRVECIECGATVGIRSPRDAVACDACGTRVPFDELAPSLFETALTEPPSPSTGGIFGVPSTGARLELSFAHDCDRPPACLACDAALPGPEAYEGQTTEIACTACGERVATWPAPPWFCWEEAQAVQVYAARLPGAEPPSQAAPASTLLRCARCGAGLELAGHNAGIVRCGYCHAEQAMPVDAPPRSHAAGASSRFWLLVRPSATPEPPPRKRGWFGWSW